MHYLTRLVEFEASHRYWNPGFSIEENHRTFGKCVSPYGHGHNYVLRVTIAGNVDPRTGMVVNVKELDYILKDLVSEFDHKFINLDHSSFHDRIPTTENLASYMHDKIEQKIRTQAGSYHLSRVRLYEEPTLWADVFAGEGITMAHLTKTFGFSAAHRLHSPVLSEEENRAVFGKCNNLHGHGHNYELEVTVHGTIDPKTGMIMDLGKLMQIVQEEILDRFDHKHLNNDTLEFRTLNPTGENIVKVIWDLLSPRLGNHLTRIGLWETPKNFFEYSGPDN
ncbi:MAG: 6-carboxytetrahydropterin synthase [Candidatus Binatia bacterium]